jgi:predicted nucleotide-binding protein
MLRRVAAALATTLLAQGLVAEGDIAEALELTTPESQPTTRAHAAPDTVPAAAAPIGEAGSTAISASGHIFVVHGHDHGLLHEVVRVLERTTARNVVVLHEQPNAGRTILEKFESHAEQAAYAVVLLTADDLGGQQGAPPAPRGRQNVIFELGFFFGKLGRRRVAVLLNPGVEQPSDTAGLVYIAIDPSGAWKLRLARELRAAEIEVDFERIP